MALGNEAMENSAEYTTCLHEVSYPPDYVAPSVIPPPEKSSKKPAKEYPFTLDPFQQEAVRCIEAGESVLV